jgi:RNA methyltransferase, TrmH family
MISLRKLSSLKETTRLRKYPILLKTFETALKEGTPAGDTAYLAGLLSLIGDEPGLPEGVYRDIKGALHAIALKQGVADDGITMHRMINNIRYGILSFLGSDPAEWDLIVSGNGPGPPGPGTVLPVRLYLEDLRSPFNVGAIFRAAESFGVERIYLSENTPRPDHPRAVRSSMGCTLLVSWSVASLEELPGKENIFALETGGCDIDDFEFPENATVLIGSEELGLSPKALSIADNSRGRVSIPLIGSKNSLNVGVACGIVLYRYSALLMQHRP